MNTIKIIHASDFCIPMENGKLDLGKSRKLLGALATTTDALLNVDIILDLSKARMPISPQDLWNLAVELLVYPRAFLRKYAVICPIGRIDLAGFFSLCVTNIGFCVRAFTTYDAAAIWLAANKLGR